MHTLLTHLNDRLGSTHITTNTSGTSVEYLIYTPFGEPLKNVRTSTSNDRYTYTGKEKDTDTGWYYYGARYYSGATNRFLSEDPLFLATGTQKIEALSKQLADPQSLNSYAYSRNNPLFYVDPDGQSYTQPTTRIEAYSHMISNLVSMGGWGLGMSSLDYWGNRMNQEGITPSTIAGVTGSITGTVGLSVLGAFLNGATLGQEAMAAGYGQIRDLGRASTSAGGASTTLNSTSNEAASTPNFLVGPRGTAYPVPAGSTGPVPVINRSGIQTGTAFTGGSGGTNGQVDTLRIMDPNRLNPNGYIKYTNGNQPTPQGVDPYTGRTVSPEAAHHPLN